LESFCETVAKTPVAPATKPAQPQKPEQASVAAPAAKPASASVNQENDAQLKKLTTTIEKNKYWLENAVAKRPADIRKYWHQVNDGLQLAKDSLIAVGGARRHLQWWFCRCRL
jgi:hypothetical protein